MDPGRMIHRPCARWTTPLLLVGLAAVSLASRGEAQAPAGTPPRGVHYLYLIRHGMYDRDSTKDERTANGLNALGREQARRLGERLAGLPVKLSRLLCSDFSRASETAAIIGQALHMTPVEDTLLHECSPRSDWYDSTMIHRAEDGTACEANLAAAWARYVRPTPHGDQHDALVCHGNVIRWFVCRAMGVSTGRWRSMDIGNASLTVIAVRADSTTRLVMFSDVGHLPVPDQTWSGRGAGWGAAPTR